MALIQLYRQAWRAARIRYYEAALRHMQRRNPCHDDIPWLVLKIHQLKQEN